VGYQQYLRFNRMAGDEAERVALGNGCQDELRLHRGKAIVYTYGLAV